MHKKILVDKGEIKAIAGLFRCTEQMVGAALNFRTNSFLARKIRKVATDRGGIDISAIVERRAL
jgi:hypothetical protein